MTYVHLGELPITTIFSLNGERYKKISNREVYCFTADQTYTVFSHSTLCIIGNYSRLSECYFI